MATKQDDKTRKKIFGLRALVHFTESNDDVKFIVEPLGLDGENALGGSKSLFCKTDEQLLSHLNGVRDILNGDRDDN